MLWKFEARNAELFSQQLQLVAYKTRTNRSAAASDAHQHFAGKFPPEALCEFAVVTENPFTEIDGAEIDFTPDNA